MKTNRLLVFLLSCMVLCCAQSTMAQQQDTLLLGLMKAHPEQFSEVLKNADEYGVQIIYTQVDRDKKNNPSLKQYGFRVNPNEYFYPASTVKLPVIAMSLEKINRLKKLGFSRLDKKSRLEIDSAYKCQHRVTKDTSAKDQYPSIAHYARKMLLVSDNDAYSRLYEFLGQEYLNNNLWSKGYPNARIVNRFAAKCDTNSNKYTNPFTFYDDKGEVIYKQTEKVNPQTFKNPVENVIKGSLQKDSRGKIISKPKDFSYSNNLGLQDIHDILTSLILPQAVAEKKRFELTTDDYKFIQKYMSMYPKESIYPRYSQKKGYNDSYKKYLIYGTEKDTITNKNIRIFNIVGLAYGYAIDCAYIVDFESNTEFFLSAVIYANNDKVPNGKYLYKTVGMPFMERLGELILDYENQRKRSNPPDLSEFKFDYSTE